MNDKERQVNFPQQLQQLIASRYPRANFSIDVYGYPGASPSFMQACHRSLMQTDAADLYVLEMTDNLSDGYSGVGFAVEELMSAVRQRAPNAAIVLLAPIPQRCVRSLKRMKPFHKVPLDDESTRMLLMRNCYGNRSVAASFEDVGAAHQLATVSARNLVREQLLRNPSQATRLITKLHYDAVHPNGFGHWMLATGLEFALLQHVKPPRSASSSSLPPECATPPAAGVLERSNIFAPRRVSQSSATVCALGDELKQHVVRSAGWSYVVERNSQGLAKPGYIARQPGATLDLCHRPNLPSGANKSRYQLQIQWSLGYLMSYEHMGKMKGECPQHESSCSCGTRIFNGHWRTPVSQPHISRLKLSIRYARRSPGGPLVPLRALRAPDDAAAKAECPCIIRFSLMNATDSGEHKFKLVSLMSGFYTGTIVGDAVSFASRYNIM